MSTTAPARVGDETTLFAELHPKLARQVRRLVRTSEENVQDACSFAFLQLLRYQPSRESVFSWLLTVAVREAVKLDQSGRRDRRFPAPEDGGEVEPVDERARPRTRWSGHRRFQQQRVRCRGGTPRRPRQGCPDRSAAAASAWLDPGPEILFHASSSHGKVVTAPHQ